jgi:hypothetical protein
MANSTSPHGTCLSYKGDSLQDIRSVACAEARPSLEAGGEVEPGGCGRLAIEAMDTRPIVGWALGIAARRRSAAALLGAGPSGRAIMTAEVHSRDAGGGGGSSPSASRLV